ncbi:MAG: tetratricopeptide repeat protein [Methanomicrobiales archaeon]|nr:tetratricopeptide repeat protein [Methanomicrobiales archaeon]
MRFAFFASLLLVFLLTAASFASGEDMTDRIVYPEYWYQQGVSEYLLQHYDRALSLLDTAIAQDPDFADAWYWRGVVLSALGDSAGSLDSIAKSKTINPTIDDPYRRRVGDLADISITPVPTPRIERIEDDSPQMIETNIDISKQPDPTGPDIIITSFEPTVREGNSQLEIKATLVNQGYRPTTDFFVTFYASDDKTITRDDEAIGYYLVTNLEQGKEKKLTGYFPMERMTPGYYYIGAIADPGNEIMEVSEDNNVMSSNNRITIPDVKSSAFLVTTGTIPFVSEESEEDSRFSTNRPDLVISKVTAPQSAVQGGTIMVNTTVKNQGRSSAGPFRISVYLSPDALITEKDREVGYGEVSDLGAGMMRDGSAVVTVPIDLAFGTYYLGVTIDSEKAINEENEANNILFADKMIAIRAPEVQKTTMELLPDLTVADLSSDSQGTPGGVMNVSTSIRNSGSGNAGPFVVELYLSSDNSISEEDILIGMGEIPELPTGTQSDGTAASPIPTNMETGLYYFGIIIDSEDDVKEINENNNIGFAQNPVSIQ